MRIGFLFCAVLMAFIMSNFAISDDSIQDVKNLPAKHVIVYYFYENFRCFSCHKIEQYTKEAVEQYFKDELKSGKLIFKPINVEEKENKHFVKDYQLYTKSVVVSLVKDGKEIKYSNLTNVWDYLRNKQKFYDYIKNEVSKYLADVK